MKKIYFPAYHTYEETKQSFERLCSDPFLISEEGKESELKLIHYENRYYHLVLNDCLMILDWDENKANRCEKKPFFAWAIDVSEKDYNKILKKS